MKKIFLITYNPGIYFNKVIFHNYITSLSSKGYIFDWWHYIDEAYIVATDLDVNSLYNAVFPGVPQRNLLVIEINPNNSQGWLPKAAWDWLQKYNK